MNDLAAQARVFLCAVAASVACTTSAGGSPGDTEPLPNSVSEDVSEESSRPGIDPNATGPTDGVFADGDAGGRAGSGHDTDDQHGGAGDNHHDETPDPDDGPDPNAPRSVDEHRVILTGLSGDFEGGGESASTFVDDGHWVLQARSLRGYLRSVGGCIASHHLLSPPRMRPAQY